MYMCCFLISPFWLFCDPMDYSPPGFSVCGTEWDAFFFSRGSPQSKNQTHVSCIGRQILYYWVHIYMFMYVYMYMYMWHTHIHTNTYTQMKNWYFETDAGEDSRNSLGLQGDQTSQS